MPNYSVERIDTATFKKWQLMDTKNETRIMHVCFGAIPLSNNEILIFGFNEHGPFSESYLVDKNSTKLSRVSVPALQDYQILQAVSVSDKKVAAFAK